MITKAAKPIGDQAFGSLSFAIFTTSVMRSTMNGRTDNVLTKADRKKAMSTAALNSLTRNALTELVSKEEKRVGSRMLAYENIARTIGSSASWVRKFISNSEEVKEPRLTLFQNIRASYENLCSRVEEENRSDERRLMLVKGELNAATKGFDAESRREDQAGMGMD